MRRHNSFMISIIVISFFVFVALFSQPVAAQNDDILKLRQKIAELENRIKDLEILLRIYQEPEKTKTGTELGWQNKKNWRKLEIGMTKDKVQSILGEPIKTIKGVRTLWYYPNIYRGHVSFDEKGWLTGWNEP
ncbi:outer membrane protein assembly factor BamE [Thermodesulfobacteriota bacterium]